MINAATDPVELLPPLPKSYTRAEALTELERLYDQLPVMVCKGLCHDSCTVTAASELECQRIEEAGASLGPRMTRQRLLAHKAARSESRCPALGPLNNCTIYAIRPFTCRVYGQAEGLRCLHGCIPDRVLSGREVHRLKARIEQLSRHVTGVRAWPLQ